MICVSIFKLISVDICSPPVEFKLNASVEFVYLFQTHSPFIIMSLFYLMRLVLFTKDITERMNKYNMTALVPVIHLHQKKCHQCINTVLLHISYQGDCFHCATAAAVRR